MSKTWRNWTTWPVVISDNVKEVDKVVKSKTFLFSDLERDEDPGLDFEDLPCKISRIRMKFPNIIMALKFKGNVIKNVLLIEMTRFP